MSKHEIIVTRNTPRVQNSKHAEPGCVRVYKQSPEDICLQIRGERRFASVSIFPDEARRIAELLIETADKFLQPLAAGELEKTVTGDRS
jgi:hypothetical protein